MQYKRVTSWILFSVAGLIGIVLLTTYLTGDVKGFGGALFAVFFLLIAGWLIGDY